jgi:hypothetical protein
VAVLLGCKAIPAPTGPAAPSAPVVVSSDTAARAIANARCDHDVACGAVGAGRTYAARDQCASELLRSAELDLSSQPCSEGLAAGRVADCAGRLRQESCHPLSTLSRMYACRPAALCVETTQVFTSEDVYGD